MTEILSNYTPEELMAVVISREIRDFETIGVGAASPIPAAGCILAEQMQAPHATIIILGSKEYYPFPSGTSALHFLAQRGEMDLFFLSGIQIDRQGNINLHVIGDYQAPQVRLPGAYGSAMLYYMAHRVILFRTEHTRRTFVEKVDFVTAAGVTPKSVYREGGPTLVVTPKALMAWDQQGKEWVLQAVTPGSSVEEVKENTGFNLKISKSVRMTPRPTERELLLLRTVVREKLERIYPDFAEKKILPR
ncbi:MAG: CoA synthetase [Deltaproteobacteria bacterium]|nr:CoA synthetase [Deltaproteobacteria bacterium]